MQNTQKMEHLRHFCLITANEIFSSFYCKRIFRLGRLCDRFFWCFSEKVSDFSFSAYFGGSEVLVLFWILNAMYDMYSLFVCQLIPTTITNSAATDSRAQFMEMYIQMAIFDIGRLRVHVFLQVISVCHTHYNRHVYNGKIFVFYLYFFLIATNFCKYIFPVEKKNKCFSKFRTNLRNRLRNICLVVLTNAASYKCCSWYGLLSVFSPKLPSLHREK